jgi:hypothetical protein
MAFKFLENLWTAARYYTGSNGVLVNGHWFGKVVGGNDHAVFLKTYSRHLPGMYYGKHENCAHAEIETRTSVMNVRSVKVWDTFSWFCIYLYRIVIKYYPILFTFLNMELNWKQSLVYGCRTGCHRSCYHSSGAITCWTKEVKTKLVTLWFFFDVHIGTLKELGLK